MNKRDFLQMESKREVTGLESISLSGAVKKLLQETKVRIAIVGSRGTGKSFLLNTLLQATAPSESEYLEIVQKEKEKSASEMDSEDSKSKSKLYNPSIGYSFNNSPNSSGNPIKSSNSPSLSPSIYSPKQVFLFALIIIADKHKPKIFQFYEYQYKLNFQYYQ